ncbi:recombinase family protein [Saccharothrix australiensis]|uniref:recombinase family protein n=1 Tax=Saccharothrix australiensis TaxID=2072 RepID=UPI001FE6020E|nr:recombinase family protein [Saccharothrix australiensis]
MVEAGPHPHPAGARRGRSIVQLEPYPETAPTVRWLFAERLAGRSIEALVEVLNQRRTPCPAEHDLERNTHRAGRGYETVDGGPHPNPRKAVEGYRLRVLAIDEGSA